MFSEPENPAGGARLRLFVYNGGFLTQQRVRRILSLAGYDIRLGLPRPDDLVGVWGNSPTAHRGLAIAHKRDVPVLRVEDAFLRSLHPGRSGEAPLGLLLDRSGPHFDPATRSDLETLLATHPLDDTALLNRARGAIERLRELHLSKYSAFDLTIAPLIPAMFWSLIKPRAMLPSPQARATSPGSAKYWSSRKRKTPARAF